MNSPAMMTATRQAPHENVQRALPDWTRMAGHYASIREIESACPVSSWRIEEAMFRLLGRGYQNAMLVPTQATGI